QLFFFFQAEDGIRDGHVTGVQTCALPICRTLLTIPEKPPTWPMTSGDPGWLHPLAVGAPGGAAFAVAAGVPAATAVPLPAPDPEIGRGACRGRVAGWGGGGACE